MEKFAQQNWNRHIVFICNIERHDDYDRSSITNKDICRLIINIIDKNTLKQHC